MYLLLHFLKGFLLHCMICIHKNSREREYLTSIGKKLVVNNISFFSGGYFTTLLVYFDTQINEVKQNFFRKQKNPLLLFTKLFIPKIREKNKAQVFYENRI